MKSCQICAPKDGGCLLVPVSQQRVLERGEDRAEQGWEGEELGEDGEGKMADLGLEVEVGMRAAVHTDTLHLSWP